jgi:dolichol kinase
MLEIIITLIGWAVALLLTEYLWHKRVVRGEYSRKLVHILISISIAFTPYYLSWRQIQVIGAVGLVAIVFMRVTHLFKSTYDIQRKSWGDVIGPASIILLAFFEPPAIIFVAVMLHTGVADGVAAIIGTKYGKTNRYKVFGYSKSLAGTGAFFVTSLLATVGLVAFGNLGEFSELIALILIVPIATTIVENIGVYGIDNALITFLTAVVFCQFI